MANAKKKPAGKKPASAKKPARAKSKGAKAPSVAQAPKAAPQQDGEQTPYTLRVRVMVYIFVVLAILFACLAFCRYP